MLGKDKVNTIEVLISICLTNSYISHVVVMINLFSK